MSSSAAPRRTPTTAVTVVVALLAVAAGLAGAWFVGMRNKDSVVVDVQRRLNRSLLNPKQMESAGTPGAYASIVRHTGRRSGRTYQTPVSMVPTDDGFLVALVYGPRTDWARNVLAAGSAVVVHEGVEQAVDRPELVDLDSVVHLFPAGSERSMRLFGVTQCLRLHRA